MDSRRNDQGPATELPDEQIFDRFPLSRWAEFANAWGDGMPLPSGVDWSAYTVELIRRLAGPEDQPTAEFPTGRLMLEGAEEDVEYNPDGSLRSWRVTARRPGDMSGR
jgi:hypothetical protein